MSSDQKLEQVQRLLESVQKMLEIHRGKNLVAGIRSALSEISNDEVTPDERISHARLNFKYMMGGMGTLGDFVIADGDEVERALLNQELTRLLEELWNILEC